MPAAPGLLVDLTGAQSVDYPDRGIARAVQELSAALTRIPGLVRGLLLNPTLPMPGAIHPELLRSPLLRWNTLSELRPLLTSDPLTYLVPSPTELGPPVATMLPSHIAAAGIPSVPLLYDLIPLVSPDFTMGNREIALRYRLRVEGYRAAPVVLSMSRSAAADAVRVLGLDPGRLRVVGGGVSAHFRPAGPGDDPAGAVAAALPALGREFAMYMAGTHERKNVPRLIEAWSRLDATVRAGLRLGVVCRLDHQPTVADWRARIAGLGLEREVVLTGGVDDQLLLALYQSARLHVFPSLFEGFGLPVAESIACGCPTITSRGGATPAVLEAPWSTFDAGDAGSIAAAIADALTLPGRLEELRALAAERAPEHTWDAVASRVAEAALSVGAAPVAPGRRLAVVAGAPATVEDSTALTELVAALAAHARVDLFHDAGGSAGVPVPDGVGSLPVGALRRRGLAAGYDAVISVLTGHAADLPALEALRSHPCVLSIRDPDMLEVLTAAARAGGEGADLARWLRAAAPDRTPIQVWGPLQHQAAFGLPFEGLEPVVATRYAVHGNGEAVRAARGIVAAGATTGRRLLLDQGPVPPAVPMETAASRGGADTARALLAMTGARPRVVDGEHRPPPPPRPGRRRLVLDLQSCQDTDNGSRGLGRAAAELAEALLPRHGVVAALLLNPQLPVPGHLPAAILDSPLLRWNTRQAIEEAREQGPIAYHLMSPFEMSTPGPISVPEHAIAAEDVALVTTLYDLIPLHEPERLLRGERGRRYRQRLELVRRSDLLLCGSEHTRRDAVRMLGIPMARTALLGGGAADRYRPARSGEDPQALVRAAIPGLGAARSRGRDIVLQVSGGDERKNTEGLLDAFARLPERIRAGHQLVVSCALGPGLEAGWRRHAQAAGLADDEVVFTGFVSDAVLVALYQAARLVVMPSTLEGYGLPVAEAIACGTPVITSDTSSLPEILALPESTFAPDDIAGMARVMARALDDAGFRERLLEAGRAARPAHTWAAAADRALAAIDALPGARPAPRRSAPRLARRLRVAMVGPLPPVRSGIADYNHRLVGELARNVQLDVLEPQRVAPARPVTAEAGYRQLGAHGLGRTLDPDGYDVILHCVGNSEHHLPTRRLALRFPGVLWLHDARLGGMTLMEALEDHAADPQAWMRRRIEEEYGDRAPDIRATPDPFDRTWQSTRGILMTRQLVSASRAVLFNSGYAERLVRLDQGPDGRMPPAAVLPFASRTLPPETPPLGWEDRVHPPAVVSFGMLDWIKAPDRLLEAVARLRERSPLRCVFAGPFWQPHVDELTARATALGILDRVEFTGDLDEAEWWEWLRRATVAVQLRRLSNGEMSGAVADAHATATPVVTNMINAPVDQPPGAVWSIDPRLLVGELEEALLTLTGDRAVWQRQSDAGRAHALRNSYAHLAEVVAVRLDDVAAGRAFPSP